jgi:F0F1-type ATP synthase assembly protein I
MDPTGNQAKPRTDQRSLMVTVGVVVGQVGCLTLVILFGAIFLGIWIDNRFNTEPWFTIGLALGSIPVTLLAMLWVVRTASAKLQQKTTQQSENKEIGG